MIHKKQFLIYALLLLAIMPTAYAEHLGSEDENPWINDVCQKFSLIMPVVGQSNYLGARIFNEIVPNIYYTNKLEVSFYQVINYLGISDAGKLAGISHFQSIVRLPEHLGLGKFLVVTGSNCIDNISQMFVIKMRTSEMTGPLTPNITDDTVNYRDQVRLRVDLDTVRWHAGGASTIGKYLVIPLEGKGAQIIFFDMTNPLEPQRLEHFISKSGIIMAAAITKLPNNHFLIAANDAGNSFHFYYSKEETIDCDWSYVGKVYSSKFAPGKNYQNATFVNDENGMLFLICTENTGKLPPVLNGEDVADLFRINYSIEGIEERIQNSDITMPIVPEFIYRKHMFCKNDQCNFAAGATVYVADSNHMNIYAIPHWLSHDGKQLRFNQYVG